MREQVLCLKIALIIILFISSCTKETGTSITPAQGSSTMTITPAAAVSPTPTEIMPVETPVIRTPNSGSVSGDCQLGLGLRQQTIPVVTKYRDIPGFIMTANVGLADEYYQRLDGWTRTIGAPSLEALEMKAKRAEENQTPYEALSYGLETSQSTPEEEWQDLVGSTRAAKTIAENFGKQLVMGPGFRLMSENEDQYPVLAEMADIWVLQTQRLQVNPPGEEFRTEVERIVNLIRSGNPEIPIWAQITFPPDREPDAIEWLAYQESIVDLVDGTYIGIYIWESTDDDVLIMNVEKIYEAVCGAER
jgi:hypothetical protein